MATITLNYDARSFQAKKLLEYVLSTGIFKDATEEKRKKSGLELALEDVQKGRVYTAYVPKNKGTNENANREKAKK
ncbi:MAG: hypothetical protein LBT42_06245 [Tannerella sp.]|jgi:hypothetical protein|nr:hypothetical protein [Tannerella sp.]